MRNRNQKSEMTNEKREMKKRSEIRARGGVWGRRLSGQRPDAIEAPFWHSAGWEREPEGQVPTKNKRIVGVGNIIRQAEATLRPK